MELATRHRGGPARGLKRCLTMAAVSLPLAGSFSPVVPGIMMRRISPSARNNFGGLRGTAAAASAAAVAADGARRSTMSSSSSRHAGAGALAGVSATLFSAEEEAVLEEKGAGHLPPWELMPFRETFDLLQRELVRYVVGVSFLSV